MTLLREEIKRFRALSESDEALRAAQRAHAENPSYGTAMAIKHAEHRMGMTPASTDVSQDEINKVHEHRRRTGTMPPGWRMVRPSRYEEPRPYRTDRTHDAHESLLAVLDHARNSTPPKPSIFDPPGGSTARDLPPEAGPHLVALTNHLSATHRPNVQVVHTDDSGNDHARNLHQHTWGSVEALGDTNEGEGRFHIVVPGHGQLTIPRDCYGNENNPRFMHKGSVFWPEEQGT